MMKTTNTTDMTSKLRTLSMLKENFKSLASALQQSDAAWTEIDDTRRATAILLAEHRMLLAFADPAGTKGSRRGVGKACQGELVARGLSADALPMALQSAMRLAIAMRPPQ